MERGEDTVSVTSGRRALSGVSDALEPLANDTSRQPDKTKKPRRRWLHECHDVLGVKDVIGAAAHVPPRGKTIERFEAAAAAFNAHPQAPFVTDGKHLRDRFHLLREQYEKKDKDEAAETGQERGESELDKLLADAIDAMNDAKAQAGAERGEATRKEQKLIADGAAIRQAAMEGRATRCATTDAPSPSPTRSAADTRAPLSSSPLAGKRRAPPDADEDGILLTLARQKERRMELAARQADMAARQADLAEKRILAERDKHKKEMTRRDRADAERCERQERIDAEARQERVANMQLIAALVQKLG